MISVYHSCYDIHSFPNAFLCPEVPPRIGLGEPRAPSSTRCPPTACQEAPLEKSRQDPLGFPVAGLTRLARAEARGSIRSFSRISRLTVSGRSTLKVESVFATSPDSTGIRPTSDRMPHYFLIPASSGPVSQKRGPISRPSWLGSASCVAISQNRVDFAPSRSVHRTAMKLSTAIGRFDAQLRANGKSPHTRVVYLRDLESLASRIGKTTDIGRIRPNHLARYLSSASFTHMPSGQPRAVVSLNRSKSALRSFFRFLTDSGHLKQNPARMVQSAPCHQKPPSCLSPDEAQRLVFLNSGLKRLLKKHIAERASADPLFLSARGRTIGGRQVQLRLGNWLKKAGMIRRCTVHTLRHTFATRLYEKTRDLRLVQRALGHRQVATTEIYSQVTDRKLRQALQLAGSAR
jgi:site-specific recombinase XerD